MKNKIYVAKGNMVNMHFVDLTNNNKNFLNKLNTKHIIIHYTVLPL